MSDEEKHALKTEFSMYQLENLEEFDLESDRTDKIWCKISQIVDVKGGKKYIALPKLILALLLVP